MSVSKGRAWGRWHRSSNTRSLSTKPFSLIGSRQLLTEVADVVQYIWETAHLWPAWAQPRPLGRLTPLSATPRPVPVGGVWGPRADGEQVGSCRARRACLIGRRWRGRLLAGLDSTSCAQAVQFYIQTRRLCGILIVKEWMEIQKTIPCSFYFCWHRSYTLNY